MDDGKPTGPQAKWWSRPTTGRAIPAAMPEDSAAEPFRGGGAATERPAATDAPPAPTEPAPTEPVPIPADAAPVPGPPQERPRPLHDADAYSTPPYGGPGPWAPAPPVQLPAPTPAHGTPLPPPYPAQGAFGGGPPLRPAHPPERQVQALSRPPETAQAAEAAEAAQWLTYDPWSSPGQPLTVHQSPAGYGEPRRERRRAGIAVTVLLALFTGVVGGVAGAYIDRNNGFSSVELPQAGPDSGGRAPDSVAGIAASALPSVVTLHVSGGDESGTGTGFVLDRQGHILTNNHVVSPANSSGEISVTFSSGETARAKLVGKDSGYDLAVVRVTGVSGLTPLPLGNSDNVRVGDPVVAIGAPFDLSNTVTSGIISAKQRPITAGGEKGDGSDVSYVDALQTDAPINPGNSGGPLVDTRARVIGINSAIRAADSGEGLGGGQSGSIGLGFAIPINQAKRVAEELINTGRATHPVIGVSLDMEYGGDGARVGDKATDGGPAVTAGGPAAKAGIKPGDVITEVDGQRVHNGEELIVKIRAHRPGDRLRLTLVRGGKERTMTLPLGSADGR
ncbi:trypsin-like peptidase domain-containing protein [Streptomyces sp. NPDC051569]|uniref:S1C family serine protease n=1 Tax=Streptomyces sp. NPDC051569 TaxID=3365661 RepID=UPI0037AFEC10